MPKSGLKHIDVGPELTKTEWESEDSHELIHGSSFPGSPVERQLFYRDDEHKWYIYSGTAWVWLGGGGGGGMEIHGNEYHDPDFATEAALASHEAAATGVHGVGGSTVESVAGSQAKVDAHKDLATGAHGVGGGTIAKVSDIAIDSNLSAAAQDAITKKHSQNTDKVLVDADADTKIQVEESADEDKIRMDVKGVEALLLDDEGILTLVKQSACRAYLSGGDQAIPNATWTKITLNAEEFDIQGEFDPITNYRFTAKKAGIYGFSALVNLLTPVDQQWIIADVRKNGNSTGQAVMPASGIKNVAVSLSGILQLAANDYLELWVYQDAGSTKYVNDGSPATFLAISKLA